LGYDKMDPDSYFLCGQSEKKFLTCCGFLAITTLVFILTAVGLVKIWKYSL